ncbi:uncharacterized protein YegP (UPF0339 family) [Haloplanus aerogenes]|uniref:Uncharacterized protein YegP (UPF0339 family) n=1 Tax=Haloplanus aerogenes TaxID=660522 RepID=A0A3M0D1A1_9EURY|nr:uncharacterized protein YegP (UPF0339 family) [Haloplanus aerogenes]
MPVTFQVFEDAAEEWRWRLVAANGEIIADSGEGYTSRHEAREAAGRVQAYAPDADVLDVDDAAFEVYEDAAGEWRWRLRHRNGEIVADSGEGYASRSGVRDAVQRVKRRVTGATVEELDDSD